MLYLSVKAAHIIFVIALMAGLLIYPRYKIHQLSSAPGEPLFDTMQDASARLKRIILTPSLIIVWLLGLAMMWLNPGLLSQGWMHVKLLLVILLSGLYGYFSVLGKRVDNVTGTVQAKRLRMLNEAPFILMIGVVILAILKPF
ncbi:MAG: CopD family protein [Hyphomonas sp.]